MRDDEGLHLGDGSGMAYKGGHLRYIIFFLELGLQLREKDLSVIHFAHITGRTG